jgi:hypothetical protein
VGTRTRGDRIGCGPATSADLPCLPELGVTGAGISVAAGSGPRSLVCATDPIAARIEDLQVTLGEGPCIDAAQSQQPVHVADLQGPGRGMVDRWPAFTAGAMEAGARAVFAIPLIVGDTTLGALDLYRTTSGDLNDRQLDAALRAATVAARGVVQHTLRQPDGDRPADWYPDATGQMQVHQATGMVMVQMGVTIESAFVMLRARAYADGRTLADLATDVIERRLRFLQEDQ